MRTKQLIILLAAIMGAGKALSQTPSLPSIIPSSPSASALQKFSEYPVSLLTGMVDIGVPIYTVEADGIKVPIELKYHASGIRYDDDSKNIGIGWTLFAGGMISGTQMGPGGGIESSTVNTFIKSVSAINPYDDGSTVYNDNYSMWNVVQGNYASEYNVYNYSFLNYSGKFFYPGASTPVLTPRRNFKISHGSVSGIGPIRNNPFTIIDEDGISYRFGQDRYGTSVVDQPSGGIGAIDFMLTEIVSADKSDTVRFNYTGLYVGAPGSDQMAGKFVISDIVTVRDAESGVGGSTERGNFPTGPGHSRTGYSYSRLDNITWKSGSVVFTYDSNNRLTAITVFNNTDSAPVKTVSIFQSFFGTNHDYYKLDSVRFQNPGNTQHYSYKFGYNGQPYAKVSGLDYWGYYNGTVEPTNYVPNFTTIIDGVSTAVGSADRTPNETAMLQGMLDTVYYPTGGHSVFTYEAHRYAGLSGSLITGGARIKSIANYDGSNNFLGMKWYKYGTGESGNGILYKSIDPADYCYTNLYAIADANPYQTYFDYTFRERVYSAFPAYSTLTQGSPVTYTEVAEYNGDGTNANGKTVYDYENIGDQFDRSGGGGSTGAFPLLSKSFSWENGNLLSKSTYKYASGTYTLLSTVQHTYKDLHDTSYMCLKVQPYLDWPQTGYSNSQGRSRDQCVAVPNAGNSFPVSSQMVYSTSPYSYANYWLTTGVRVLDSTVEINDGVSRTTRYTYDGLYDKARTVTTTESNSVPKISQYTYAFDMGTTPYTGMVAANILNPVLRQDEYKTSAVGGNLLRSTITGWDNWSGAYYKPLTASTQTGSASPEVRVRYSAYDALGNIKTVARENGPKTTYIFSYNGAYPVAEIQNADYSAVETALGGSTAVASFRDSNPSDATVASFLAPLRTSSSLSDALVTTYTYDPLMGMTSAKDAKGETTYYEYDGFGRLSTVKDKDHNIIKAICYNYKGEATENCYISASRNVIYARLEGNSYAADAPVANGYGGTDVFRHVIFGVHFYSDAACTIPYAFATSTTVQIQVTESVDGTAYGPYTISMTVPGGSSSYTNAYATNIGQDHTYYDYYETFTEDFYTWDYEVINPTSGDVFVAVPTHITY